MLENLIFSLNATVPVFLLMILGLVFRKIGWIDDVFAAKMNSFVFKATLPLLVFEDLAVVDFKEAWNFRFVSFCFLVTLFSILFSSGISYLWKDRSIQGEFIQASYRSSAAILGIAFIQNIYGTSGMGPMMIIGSVPLYNIMAVIVLSFFQPERKKLDGKLLKKTLLGILKNPIILGIVAGLIWSYFRLPFGGIFEKTVNNVARTATPLGLMAMGASFDIRQATGKLKPAVTAAVIKLVGFVMIFLPMAVMLGFRGQELVAIMIMLGSATTVSCYVMAKNMGHDGVLTSSVVMLTTMFSAFTITLWLYVLRSMALI